MRRARLLAAVCVADALFGDPAWLPHPVRVFGAAIELGERRARAYARGDARRERAAGTILCAMLVAGTYVASATGLALAWRAHPRAGDALEIALGWTTLAGRDLLAEAGGVAAALEASDLTHARTRVARIVGRDTAALAASDVARAAIETLAESACDGIAAPLFALALGGVPLALAFKAASTLDSTIGHIEAPYTHLGRTSAKLDDAACYVPARATALALALCAPYVRGSPMAALVTLRNDGHKHRSPNAGHPEASMAGALGVRLGGRNRYGGAVHEAPLLGAKLPAPTAHDVRRAMRLVTVASLVLATALALATSKFSPLD